MDLLTRFRAEVPARVSPEAERRFYAAFPSEPSVPPRRAHRDQHRRGLPRPRLVLAAALAATAAATVIATVPHSPASRPASGPPATPPTVRELAYRASSAALAAKPVGPGQWMYQRSTVTVVLPGGGHGKDTAMETWQTADDLRSAWYHQGQLSIQATPTEGRDISYAELANLPASPRALVKYVYGRERQILGPEPANLGWQMTFNEIAGLLSYFVLPPKTAAALFQAIPAIPGVRVVKESGSLAFIRSYANLGTEKVFLSPSTYTVTGAVLTSPGNRPAKQFTISVRTPVSGPGVHP